MAACDFTKGRFLTVAAVFRGRVRTKIFSETFSKIFSGLHAGGGGADGEDAGQEQRVLRQLDTEQHQDRGL